MWLSGFSTATSAVRAPAFVVASAESNVPCLSDGTIPAGARLDKVGAVRFTKQLSTRPVSGVPAGLYGEEAYALVKAKERTVFLINTRSLDSFLDEFNVDDRDKYG